MKSLILNPKQILKLNLRKFSWLYQKYDNNKLEEAKKLHCNKLLNFDLFLKFIVYSFINEQTNKQYLDQGHNHLVTILYRYCLLDLKWTKVQYEHWLSGDIKY